MIAGSAFAGALALAGLATLAAVALPRRLRRSGVGLTTALAGAAAVLAGAAALTGDVVAVHWPDLLPLTGFRLRIDPLGGLFVAVTGGVTVAAAVFGIGYSRHGLDGRLVQAAMPVFVAAMLLVPAAGSVGTFLVCWELTALASLLLVTAEHARRPTVADAGLWYAVMTHAGFVAILSGLLLFAVAAGDDSFTALRAAAGDLTPAARSAVFVACFLGFAAKAGIVPLHAWLPRAHPEAPSQVSALMSAAMVNLGVYGILRVGFDLLGTGPQWWWLLVLALGSVSGIHGILQAAVTSDIKRLLGHSTTENMGLVLVGIGAAGMFASTGDHVLAGLALTAAMLHVVNHSAFKTLLFLAAGSVVSATGSRDLDRLGGLRRSMPVTTALFGVGALAASALPPGNAFISEWLLLQSLVHGLPASGVVTAVTMPVAVAVVALTAGLAVVTFVKAFGVGFLARPRSEPAALATERPASMVIGMGVAAVACAVLGLAPATVLPAVSRAVAATDRLGGSPVHGLVTIRVTGVVGALSPLLIAGLLLTVVLVLAGLLRMIATARSRRAARLWDCGAGPLTARMEYTATSFAEPVQRVFDNVLRPEQDVDVSHVAESRYLVDSIAYRRNVPDRVERRLYEPLLSLFRAWGDAGRRLANGSVHRYLAYGFCTLLVLLLAVAVLT